MINSFMFGVLTGLSICLAIVKFTDAKGAEPIIAHHCAHYDPQTGAFTWDQPEAKP